MRVAIACPLLTSAIAPALAEDSPIAGIWDFAKLTASSMGSP